MCMSVIVCLCMCVCCRRTTASPQQSRTLPRPSPSKLASPAPMHTQLRTRPNMDIDIASLDHDEVLVSVCFFSCPSPVLSRREHVLSVHHYRYTRTVWVLSWACLSLCVGHLYSQVLAAIILWTYYCAFVFILFRPHTDTPAKLYPHKQSYKIHAPHSRMSTHTHTHTHTHSHTHTHTLTHTLTHTFTQVTHTPTHSHTCRWRSRYATCSPLMGSSYDWASVRLTAHGLASSPVWTCAQCWSTRSSASPTTRCVSVCVCAYMCV